MKTFLNNYYQHFGDKAEKKLHVAKVRTGS